MANYLTQKDVDEYGHELIDLNQRAALQAVAPHLQNLQQQNAALQQQLAREARHRLDSQVAAAVPNFREIDRDERWHAWLLSIVIGFFRGWQREAGADAGDAAPSRQQPSKRMPLWGASGPRIYSRAEIAKLYRQHAQNAYVGREAEWARQEADIIAAGREGRIQNPEAVGVK